MVKRATLRYALLMLLGVFIVTSAGAPAIACPDAHQDCHSEQNSPPGECCPVNCIKCTSAGAVTPRFAFAVIEPQAYRPIWPLLGHRLSQSPSLPDRPPK